ncbi:hypothetical protein Leryth_008888 [Lithospermum erythrorhizon]|nr:hypothetical protein Leryth_008888 [Lithospermum erythrorhizon]
MSLTCQLLQYQPLSRRHHHSIPKCLSIKYDHVPYLPQSTIVDYVTCSLKLKPSTNYVCSRVFATRCSLGEFADSIDPDWPSDHELVVPKVQKEEPVSVLKILREANSILPHVVLASTILALVYPPSFTWFTNKYYAPALGFLMFAVGVNSSGKDFIEAFNRPGAILAGYVGQFMVKPFLGYLFGTISMTMFGLPTTLAAGIMLTSCVSGAQLSNYATFLTDPSMAPLSIVMTSLSTASAVFVTPLLSLLLIGTKLPIDVKGMISNILQIVIAPIAAGLFLNRFFPVVCSVIRPLLPPLSVLVTAHCVGAPLALNIKSVMSPAGISVLLLVIAFHISAFVAGYFLPGLLFHNDPDVKALQRTLSYETGMQSSLLALSLANSFFKDPLVSVPPAISTVIMSLMGFSLVMLWAKKSKSALK